MTTSAITNFAPAALARLNTLLLPHEVAAVGELQAAGLRGSAVAALYPFDADAYRPGITALRADKFRAAQVKGALRRARLDYLFQYVTLLPDATGALPKDQIPGPRTPIGDKRALRLLASVLHALSTYEFKSEGATSLEVDMWRLTNQHVRELAVLLERLEKVPAAAPPARVRPPLSGRQFRRHARNYPRRAGNRLRRRR